MISTIITSLTNVINTFFGWLSDFNEQVHLLDIALGLFLVITLSRFFIKPMLKGHFVSGSDTVKEQKNKDDGIEINSHTIHYR